MVRWCKALAKQAQRTQIWSLEPTGEGENRLLELSSDRCKQAVRGTHEQQRLMIIRRRRN